MADPVTVVGHCYKWDIHEVVEEDEPARVQIRAWCLDRKTPDHDSESYLLRIENFSAFCHIELPKSINGRPKTWDRLSINAYMSWLCGKLGQDKPIKASFAMKPKIYFYRASNEAFPMLLVHFNSMKAMTHCENFLKTPRHVTDLGLIKANVWETSITVVRKLLTTKNCGYSQWFSIEGVPIEDEDLRTSTLAREYIADWRTMTPLGAAETKGWVSNPRILAFDIETYSNNHRAFPNKFHALHVAYMVSCIFQRLGDKSSRKRYGILLGECDEMLEPDGTRFAELSQVKSELGLVNEMGRIIMKTDPEIISGYNIVSFDYPYLDARLKRRGHEWPQMGRLKDVTPVMTTKTWKSSAYGHNRISILHMDGRISIDMLPLVKRDYKLDKYDLDFVSRFFLGDKGGKHDIKAREMFVILENLRRRKEELDNTPNDEEKKRFYADARADMTRVMKYCIQDSELVIELFEKLNIWIALVELSNIVGVGIMELFTSGQQIRCVSQMYNLAATLNFVLDKREMLKVHFSGGVVYKPIPRVF